MNEQTSARIKRMVESRGSLFDSHPETAKYWHPILNGDLTPKDVTAGSKRKVWWFCDKGHPYRARIYNKTCNKSLCPICSGHEVLAGYNDLETLCPDAAKYWDYEENGNITPKTVTSKSNKTAHWKCDKGHRYHMKIYLKTKGIGCPVCRNYQLEPGVNDLLTLYPKIVKELHPYKNGNIKLEEIIAYTNARFWFVCTQKHEFLTNLCSRTAKGTGCSKCSGKNRIDNLAKRWPKVAANWHPSRNNGLIPDDFAPYSEEKVWWKNPCGHEYRMKIYEKARFGPDCAVCDHRQVAPGLNDLASQYPEIAAELHSDKNGSLTAQELPCRFYKKAWWLCSECKHEYQMIVRKRTQDGAGCPKCRRAKELSAQRAERDAPYLEAIQRWHREMPYLGSRKIVTKLAEEGLEIGRGHVKRIMNDLELRTLHPKRLWRKQKQKRTRIFAPYLLRYKEIFLPNQVWAIDITFLKPIFGRMYLIAIIDWHSKFIVGWEFADSQKTAIIIQTVKKAMDTHGVPAIINSDKGVQFASRDYTRFLKDYSVRQSMTGAARWVNNLAIERWFRSVKYEIADIDEYDDPKELRKSIETYVKDYNHRRPHDSLGGRVPAEVYESGFGT